MSDDLEKPNIPPFVELKPVDGCFPTPPEGFQPFSPECPSLVEVMKMLTGGRAVIVTPYDDQVCSGDEGRFQILTGFGGQVCNALYIGNTVGRDAAAEARHGVSIHAGDSEPDCIFGDPSVRGGPNGDKGIAIRDKGRWYVVKLGGTAVAPRALRALATVIGGNTAPITAGVSPDYLVYKPWAFKQKVLEASFELPEVEDWEDYDLPSGFAHGDFLPEKALPFGYFWARLSRGQRLGGRIWNAGSVSFSPIGGSFPALQGAYVDPNSPSVIVLVFNDEIWLNVELAPVDVPDFISVETNSSTSLEVLDSLPSKQGTIELAVSVSRVIELEEDVKIEISELLVFNEAPSGGENQGEANSPEEEDVIFNDPRGAYVLCFNYSEESHLYLGDGVETGATENVADNSDNIRRVALCSQNAKSDRPVLNAVLKFKDPQKDFLEPVDSPEDLPALWDTAWDMSLGTAITQRDDLSEMGPNIAWAEIQPPDGDEAQAENGKKMGPNDRDRFLPVFVDSVKLSLFFQEDEGEKVKLFDNTKGLVYVDSVVLLSDGGATDGEVREVYRFVPILESLVIPVKMDQDGGEDGDKTEPATWTYKVETVDGKLLAEGVNPDGSTADPEEDHHKYRRPRKGKMKKATFGHIYLRIGDPEYDPEDGDSLPWGFLGCNEHISVSPCD